MTRELYVASWTMAPGRPWLGGQGMTGDEYRARFDRAAAQGYRPTCVSACEVDGEARYAALFVKAPGGAWVARDDLTGRHFQHVLEVLGPRGYRPRSVNAYTLGGEPAFAVVWEQADGPAWTVRHGLTADAFGRAVEELLARGQRLRWVTTYAVDGQERYAALWDAAPGPAWQARHGLDEPAFRAASLELAGQGYALVCADACHVDGTDRYAALWQPARGTITVDGHGMSREAYRRRSEQLAARGLRPVFVAAFAGGQPADGALEELEDAARHQERARVRSW